MKSVKIGEMTLEVPIIQGGMGVGISLGNLAGNVALNGGMGVISTAQPGYRAADFEKNTVEANRRELASEIQKAKEIAKGKGIVAINAMVALTDYAGMVEVAVKNKIDAIYNKKVPNTGKNLSVTVENRSPISLIPPFLTIYIAFVYNITFIV